MIYFDFIYWKGQLVINTNTHKDNNITYFIKLQVFYSDLKNQRILNYDKYVIHKICKFSIYDAHCETYSFMIPMFCIFIKSFIYLSTQCIFCFILYFMQYALRILFLFATYVTKYKNMQNI